MCWRILEQEKNLGGKKLQLASNEYYTFFFEPFYNPVQNIFREFQGFCELSLLPSA